MASDVLKQVPEVIDYESTYKLICDDMNPLNVVLLQEVCTVGSKGRPHQKESPLDNEDWDTDLQRLLSKFPHS